MATQICETIDTLLSFIDGNTDNKITVETITQTCLKITEQFKDGSVSDALAQCKPILNNYIQSEYETDVMKYLRDEWITTVVTELMNIDVNHCTIWSIADTVVHCCKLLMQIAVSLIKNNHIAGSHIIAHMNADKEFFKTFGCHYHEQTGYMLDEKETEALDEWRTNEIKEHSYVDYLFYNRWRYGLVTHITHKTNESNDTFQVLKIQPQMNEIPTATNCHEFTLSSSTCNQIAKPLTHFETFGATYFNTKGTYLTDQQTEELKEWRTNQLTTGSYVDYLYYNKWRYGQINQVWNFHSASGELRYKVLRIQQKMDEIPIENYYDEFILSATTRSQICKPLTKSIAGKPKMLLWRKELKISDPCDVMDKYNRWYTAKVIDENIALNTLKIHYNEWEEKWDCWIARDDIKLQPYLSIAKGGRKTPVNGCLEDMKTWVEDAEDDEKYDTYLIYRGGVSVSLHLVDIYNEFGKIGGFDAILQMLFKENALSINELLMVIKSLLHIHKNFSRQYAYKFVGQLSELTLDKLESLSYDEYSELNQTDTMDIIGAIKVLFSRFKSKKEIDAICQELHLDLAYKKLKCASKERQVEATDFICGVCSDIQWLRVDEPVNDTRVTCYICPDFFNDWITHSNLVQIFFGPSRRALCELNMLVIGYVRNNYKRKYLPLDVSNLIVCWYNDGQQSHLIPRSQTIMEYITEEGYLTIDNLESVWNAIENALTNNDEMDIWEICNIVENIKDDFDETQRSFLLTKLQGIESSESTYSYGGYALSELMGKLKKR